MNIYEFADTVSAMPAEMQNEFFEILRNELSEEDCLTVMKFVSLNSLFKSPAKYEAMKHAVGDMFCEKYFGRPYSPAKRIDDSEPTHMTTIL